MRKFAIPEKHFFFEISLPKSYSFGEKNFASVEKY